MPDQTRLKIEKMEGNRAARRQRASLLRTRRAAAERANLANGNGGDHDFVGLVAEWRATHGGAARPHGDDAAAGAKIRVCVRKRPLSEREVRRREHDAVTCLHPTATVHSSRLKVDGISKYCDHQSFRFDHAFDEGATTEEVYRHTAAPLVRYVCGGRGVPRATVFAYGQTGSGKTYTMEGIERMVAEDLFRTLDNNAFDGDGCFIEDTTVSVAIFEIYGDRVQDLLNDRQRLKVLEDGRGEAVVVGLEEFRADDPSVFLALIERGQRNRTTHATEANDVSSRSHAICQINFRDASGRLRGKLSLVDLAGSERGSDTKSHDRQRRVESGDINTSLLALKECIRAIDSNSRHVPYRQSKLTLILKDCFVSRAARTAMIATVSPGSMSTDHTVNTLRYADRIKEKKVDAFFSSSGRSPTRSVVPPIKQSPVQERPADRGPDTEWHNDLEKLDKITNAPNASIEDMSLEDTSVKDVCVENTAVESSVAGDESGEGLSDHDHTVKKLLEEEENLLNVHMTNIQENASLLSEETSMLASIQDNKENDIDQYASRLGEILDQKTVLIHSLQDQLGSFRELLRSEEELSTV